jgi:hypothetical protein
MPHVDLAVAVSAQSILHSASELAGTSRTFSRSGTQVQKKIMLHIRIKAEKQF